MVHTLNKPSPAKVGSNKLRLDKLSSEQTMLNLFFWLGFCIFDLDRVTGLWNTNVKILGLSRILEVPECGLTCWFEFKYCHWSLIQQWFKYWLSKLNFIVQRASMSFKYWFGPVEDAAAYWLKFGILILIWIWSLVFNTPMFKILALCLYFEITKNIYVLCVLIWAFGGCWSFLTFVGNIDHNLDMVPGLWYNLVPNFVPLSLF